MRFPDDCVRFVRKVVGIHRDAVLDAGAAACKCERTLRAQNLG